MPRTTPIGGVIKYCPFMTRRYNGSFFNLVIFGIVSFNAKKQECLKGKCGVWNPEHKACSFFRK